MKSRNICDKIFFACLIAITALFVIINSTSTNLLFYGEHIDSNIYQYMGYSMLKGKIPYVDIFDHKGPFLYLLEAIGLFFGGRQGILLLQILNLITTVILWYKAFSIKISKYYKYACIAVTLLCLFVTYSGGNMTEEWGLLLNTIVFYIYIKNIEGKFSILQLFCIGLCLGLQFLIRANNAAPAIGVLLYCLIKSIYKKEWFYIIKSLIFISIGGILPIIIACICFYSADGLKGLDNLFYGVLFFNIDYTSSIKVNDISSLLGCCSYFYKVSLPTIALLLVFRKEPDMAIPLIIALCILVMSIGGNFYNHYLITFIPIFYFSLLTIGRYRFKWLVLLIAVLPFPLREINKHVQISFYSDNYNLKELDSAVYQVLLELPDSDRGEVWNALGAKGINAIMERNIIQSNRMIIPFQLQLSKRLYNEENGKIKIVKPQYVLFAEFPNDDYSGMTCTEDDISYIKKYYESVKQIKCHDGTIVFLKKRTTKTGV